MEENKEIEAIEDVKAYTIEDYVQSQVPNSKISDKVMRGILADSNVEERTPLAEVDERGRDLAVAYLYKRIAMNPISSQKVTDRDADWEHSEGNEIWSRQQLQQFLVLARKLLSKWGISDEALESIAPKWGFVGRGHRNVRTFKRR